MCILTSGVAAIPQTFVSLLIYSAQDAAAPPLLSVLAQTIAAASAALLIGCALIIFPSTVANRLVLIQSTSEEGSAQYGPLQKLAFSVLGLYFVAVGLFDIIYWYARARLYYSVVANAATAFPNAPAMTPDDFSGFVSAVAYLIGGIVILVGAHRFSGLVRSTTRTQS
jgi:hypothetical protein